MVWRAAADAVARFQHDDGEAGILQRMRGAEAGGAGADDGDIDCGGEGRHALASSTFALAPEALAPEALALEPWAGTRTLDLNRPSQAGQVRVSRTDRG